MANNFLGLLGDHNKDVKKEYEAVGGKMWMEGVQAAMTTRNLEPDQWRNKEEWCFVSERRRQLL